MLPMTVVSGIGGRTEDGFKFPRWTIRMLGRLTLSTEGFSWTPLLPWRRPRLVEVPWSAVSQLHFFQSGSTQVQAKGWPGLMLAPNKRKRVIAAVEEAGFALDRHPAWPGDVVAHRPDAKPVWPKP